MRTKRFALVSGVLLAAGVPAASHAATKEIAVKVDARSVPWSTGANRKYPFGLADGRPATVVWGAILPAGGKIRFQATGTTTTVAGGQSVGPDGQSDWQSDRGMALFPSHYMKAGKKPICLNQLVGAFIDADGAIVGKPFAIGTAAEVEVPEGAAAISLGLNDDRYSDNAGTLQVAISIPLPKVTVEPDDAK